MPPLSPALLSGVVLQIPDVPDGPSPIDAVVSLLALVVVALVLGYVAMRVWRRVADHVRYDDRTRD